MSGGQIGPISVEAQFRGERIRFDVAGWVKGPFGLDFRVFDDSDGDFFNPGFILTHLPTGWVVRQLICGSISEAQALADEILAGADWTFAEKPTVEHSKLVKAIMEKHPGTVATGHRVLTPAA